MTRRGENAPGAKAAAGAEPPFRYADGEPDFALVDAAYYDNLTDKRVAAKRNFVLAIFGNATALVAVLALVAVFFSGRYKFVIVPFNERTGIVGTAVVADAKVDRVPPKAIDGLAADWITDLRSVTPDPITLKRYNSFVYGHTATTAQQFVDDYFRDQTTNPFVRARTGITVEVKIERVDTVQDEKIVTWTEITRATTGDELKRDRHGITLTIRQGGAPTDLAGAQNNPFSLYITRARWSDPLG